MKILFDQGTPVPLRWHLAEHTVNTVYERGLSRLSNGDLLDAAVQEGYEVLITTDQNLKYQQNLAKRKIAVIVLLSTSWPRIKSRVDEIQTIVDGTTIGDYIEIPI